jgi:hypothetical protein
MPDEAWARWREAKPRIGSRFARELREVLERALEVAEGPVEPEHRAGRAGELTLRYGRTSGAVDDWSIHSSANRIRLSDRASTLARPGRGFA